MAIGKFKNITKKVITSTTVSEYAGGMITNKKALSAKCLSLIQKQKDFVLTLNNIFKITQVNGLYLTNLTGKDVNDTFVQLDIRNCYPSIAVDNGLTTTEIFNEMNNLQKEERLVVLGAVSSSKTERVFTGTKRNGSMKFKTIHKPATNEYFFFNLMNILSEINRNVIKKLTILGVYKYLIYCDAVLIKEKDYERLRKSIGNLENFINKDLTENVNYRFDGVYELIKIGRDERLLTFSKYQGKDTIAHHFLNIDTGDAKILNV